MTRLLTVPPALEEDGSTDDLHDIGAREGVRYVEACKRLINYGFDAADTHELKEADASRCRI